MKHHTQNSFFTFKKSMIWIAVFNLFASNVQSEALPENKVTDNFTITSIVCDIYRSNERMTDNPVYTIGKTRCINIKPKNDEVSVTILGDLTQNGFYSNVLVDREGHPSRDISSDTSVANYNKKYTLKIHPNTKYRNFYSRVVGKKDIFTTGYVRNIDGSLSIGLDTGVLENDLLVYLSGSIVDLLENISYEATIPKIEMPLGSKPVLVSTPRAGDGFMTTKNKIYMTSWSTTPGTVLPELVVGKFKTNDGSPITVSKQVYLGTEYQYNTGTFYMKGDDLYYKPVQERPELIEDVFANMTQEGNFVLTGKNGFNNSLDFSNEPFKFFVKYRSLIKSIRLTDEACKDQVDGSDRTCVKAEAANGVNIFVDKDNLPPNYDDNHTHELVSIEPILKSDAGVIPDSVLSTVKVFLDGRGDKIISFKPGDYSKPMYVEYKLDGLGNTLVSEATMKRKFLLTNKPPVISDISTNKSITKATDIVGFNVSDDDGFNNSNLTIEKAPLNGVIVDQGDVVYYRPNAGYVGTDTIKIKVTDRHGASVTKEATYTMQNGAEIKGTISSSNSIGIVPFSSNLSIVLNDASTSGNVSGFNWESSTDNGVTWKNFSKSSSASLYMTTPGAYLVRVGIANKFSGKIFTTPAITVQASVAELPVMKIEGKIDSLNVPSNVLLKLIPNSPVDAVTMKGQKYTYEWVLPTGVTGEFKGSAGVARFEAGGTHEIIAKMSDAFGNTQDVVYSVDLLARKPIEFTFEVKKTIPVERNPMAYFLRPTIRLWHSKDKITEYKLSVDSQVIGKPSSRFSGYVSGLNAGVHNIKLEYKTLLGEEGSSELDVTVAQNQVPTCELSNRLIEKTKMMLVAAKCKDVDGKIKSIMWNVDGVDLPRSTAGISVDMSSRSSSTVNVKVTDDSGDVGTASISF